MLGHLGETLPFLLWRFDSRAKFYGIKLAKPPSDYIKQNIMVTTSGMCSAEPLNCTIAALGPDRVMFAADYPFELAQEAGEFLDHAPLRETVARTSRQVTPQSISASSRHPEVRAQRASKDARPGPSPFEGRYAATSG